MTTDEAFARALQTLGATATEDAMAEEMTRLMMPELSPADEARLVREALEEDVFAWMVDNATRWTEEQIRAMDDVTDAQRTHLLAAHRQLSV